MQLQTNISLQKARNPINYQSNILMLGSCFVENIGNELEYFKFQSVLNPFGILFNPVAIEKLITRALNLEFYKESELVVNNDVWNSFDAHSRLGNTEPTLVLGSLNKGIEVTNKQLTNASHIIITLGTAWVYRFIEKDELVANCHKLPQKKFLKELLPIEDICANIENINTLIKSVNPEVNIIYTVSPVRHIKDGFVENQRSKSHLIAALHELLDPRNKLHYFPSYEIMMDELRDYRFYDEDMIHPNKMAIGYIWEKFRESWISVETIDVMKQVDLIQRGLNHKPFNPNSEPHKIFLKDLKEKISYLQQEYPFMRF